MARRKLPLCGKRWNEPTLRELLVGQLAGTLGVHRIEIDPTKSFDEYGLDSINAVIATELIGERLGIELPPEFLLLIEASMQSCELCWIVSAQTAP